MSDKQQENSKILLVEDNPDDEELTLLAFRNNNIQNCIDVARDGEEALDYLFIRGKFSDRNPSSNPRLVILDLKLPKIVGFEVLRQIRENPMTRHLPVVILTTSSHDEDILNSYRCGANSYIRKPVDFQSFSEAIKHLGMYWLLLNQAPPCLVR
ncbi:MAG: response regulator [Spirochaetia bacterium]|jgi:two-component system response regulator|nr:response regulator [Spirochaetia bacterium]